MRKNEVQSTIKVYQSAIDPQNFYFLNKIY